MSDNFKPEPWQVPTPDGVQRPVTMQTRVVYPADASQADRNLLFQVAGQIVADNTTAIHRFLNNNRQQNFLNKQAYTERSIQLDQMNARWRINQTQEKLELEVFPSGGQEIPTTTSETNLDGYIAWIHCDPGYPDLSYDGTAQFLGPYNVIFNGYLIEENYQPNGPTGGYPILFGPTALLCASYVGDKEDRNPLVKEQTLRQPNKIIPQGGWGSYKDGSSPIGQEQQSYQKEFGYWIFDWLNVLNECQYIYPFGVGGGYKEWNDYTAFYTQVGPAAAPVFTRGLYFKSSQPNKSPLKPKGMNSMSALLAPQSKGSGEVPVFDIFIAEFYDRGKYRTATQSWTIASQPRQTIAINDSPLIFGGVAPPGDFSTGAGFTFNLDPKQTKNFKDTNGGGTIDGTDDDLVLGPHDGLLYLSAGNQYAAFTPEQLAEYNMWAAMVRDDAINYEDDIINEVTPLKKKMTDTVYPAYQNAYKLAIVARQIAGNVHLFEKQFDDYIKNGLYWDAVTQSFACPVNANGPVTDPKNGLSTGNVETQTLYIDPNGNYKYSVNNAPSYGPQQLYYMDLTIPLTSGYGSNLEAPAALLDPYYIAKPNSTTTTVVPPLPYPPPPAPPPPVVTTTISGPAYQPDGNYPFLGGTGNVLSGSYLGPTTYAGLLAYAITQVPSAVDDYISLGNQIQSLLNQKPPDSPPFPNLGDDISEFTYSEISIEGDWSYDQ